MSDIDDFSGTDDTLAGEYVLGLLEAGERESVERRARSDDALARAIAYWEARLMPLADGASAETAAGLFARIERSLEGDASRTVARTTDWWNSLALWRTLGTVSLALAVAFGVALFRPATNPTGPRFVAMLKGAPDTSGWIVQIDAQGRLALVPLGRTEVPEQRVLQFWTKAPTASGPTSLGLVPPDRTTAIATAGAAPVVADQLFELTLEPAGGSTIGRPTGPILFVGRAVAVN